MPTIITPDLCDEFSTELQVMQPALKHYGGKTNFYGEVVTIACFEDNSKVGKTLRNENGKGKVLVVDGGGSLRRALLGDMIAEAAIENEWEGVIINGCLRDVEMIRAMNLGVMALASIPLKTVKRDLGDINVPVSFLSVNIEPGNYIYADETGVIVAARDFFNADV